MALLRFPRLMPRNEQLASAAGAEQFDPYEEVPLYQLFYDGEEPPAQLPIPSGRSAAADTAWGSSSKDARLLFRLRRLLSRVNQRDRKLLLSMAQRMAKPKTIHH